MKFENAKSSNIEEKNNLNERIQKLKYAMIYDYKNRQYHDNLMMFIMEA